MVMRAWEKFIALVSSLHLEISFDMNGVPTWSVGLGAIDFILRLSSDAYESLYYQMPEKQRMLFLAIAKERKATTVTGGQFIKKHKLNSASSVSSALKGLLDKDFITLDKNAYSVYDQFFSPWLTFKGMI